MNFKRYILAAGFFLFSTVMMAQDHFETVKESSTTTILKGLITRNDILKSPSSEWFAANQQGYTPNSLALEALKKYGPSIHIIAYIGTWCEDTRFILPKFYALVDAAAFPASQLTMIGVDRDKKTLHNLSEALNIINVPTFIVMKEGKELGRVVEYGKFGMWDKELGQVIQTVAQQ
jgi:thiol-disulfide isomerase/thioredoxin